MLSPRRRLLRFFVLRFANDEAFKRFVRDHFDAEVSAEVNWEAQLTVQVESFLAFVIDKGMIKHVWPPLREEREEYLDEIRSMEEEWLAAASGNAMPAQAPPAAAAPFVDRELLAKIYRAARDARLEGLRPALFVGVEPLLVPPAMETHGQLWIDLNQLCRAGGEPPPLTLWLANARVLAGDEHAETFASLLEEISAPAQPEAMSSAAPEEDEREITLEAIVLASERPAIPVVNGTFGEVAEPWRRVLEPRRELIEHAIAATGRIETPGKLMMMEWAGTGVVVGPDLVAVARHVADLIFDQAGALKVDNVLFDPFRENEGGADPNAFVVSTLLFRHPVWDIAFLSVPGLSARGVRPLALATEPPPSEADVVRVTFVSRDSRADVALQAQVFGARLNGAKWIMPGKTGRVPPLRDKPLKGAQTEADLLAYDTNTLSGTGGPVVSAETGQLLGFSVSRRYLLGNWAVPAWEIARDKHIQQLGIATAAASPP